MFDAERAKALFNYDPETGILTRKYGRQGIVRGTTVKFDLWKCETSRVIWLIHYGKWPTQLVDHKDRNRLNNRIDNLREADYHQNGHNMASRNPFYKGVTFDANRSKHWRAQIRIAGRKTNLGRFHSAEDAAAAYQKAAIKYHGEFACLE